jgi:signal transduction histidine kinase
VIDQAIRATPRGERVLVRAGGPKQAPIVSVEDGGPVVPIARRADLLRRRVDPASLGRPSGLSLLVADAAAHALGAELTLGESAAGRAETSVEL